MDQGSDIIVIGGMLERCMTGYLLYHDSHYRGPDQAMYYFPELSVKVNEKEVEKATTKLISRDIHPIDMTRTMTLLRD